MSKLEYLRKKAFAKLIVNIKLIKQAKSFNKAIQNIINRL